MLTYILLGIIIFLLLILVFGLQLHKVDWIWNMLRWNNNKMDHLEKSLNELDDKLKIIETKIDDIQNEVER